MNKKIKIRYFVNIVALISFLIVAFTGLAIKFFMPSGVRRTGLQEFLGYTRHTWTQTHDIAGIIMIILVIIHFLLYWKIFAAMTKSFFKEEEISEVKKEKSTDATKEEKDKTKKAEESEAKDEEKTEESKEAEINPFETEMEKSTEEN